MLAVDGRLTLVERKMHETDVTLARIEAVLLSLDSKVDKLDLRVDRLDQRMEKLFLWVIGIQMTILITIAGGLFGIVAKLI